VHASALSRRTAPPGLGPSGLWSGPLRSGLMRSGLVRSGPALPGVSAGTAATGLVAVECAPLVPVAVSAGGSEAPAMSNIPKPPQVQRHSARTTLILALPSLGSDARFRRLVQRHQKKPAFRAGAKHNVVPAGWFNPHWFKSQGVESPRHDGLSPCSGLRPCQGSLYRCASLRAPAGEASGCRRSAFAPRAFGGTRWTAYSSPSTGATCGGSRLR
jgi:hypothetical protein